MNCLKRYRNVIFNWSKSETTFQTLCNRGVIVESKKEGKSMVSQLNYKGKP